MKTFARVTALLLPLGVHALDLTPKHSVRELEGVKIPVVHFADSGRAIRYQPPSNWQLSGRGRELSLYPPDRAEAVVKFQLQTRKLPSGSGAETPDDLQKVAAQFIPASATEVTLSGTSESPFTLGALGSREFVFTYVDNGRRFTTAVILIELDERERFAMTIHARAGDFETIRREAIASMFSWQPVN